MTDKEIIQKREDLQKEYQKVHADWKAYDERYPVIPGREKPFDYDSKQRMFFEGQRELSGQIARLPKTKAEKLKFILIWLLR